MGILTSVKKIINRKSLAKDEDDLVKDLIEKNKEDISSQISQRRGFTTCSGLSVAERDYILSDSVIASGIQLYLADISSICNKNAYILQSNIAINENNREIIAKKEAKAKFILEQIFSDKLIEAIGLNLLNNGEIFLNTIYSKGLNKYTVTESSYTRCTQLCLSNGKTAIYVVSNSAIDNTSYSYSCNFNSNEEEYIPSEKMVRIYVPTLANSKICIELDDEDKNDILKNLTTDSYLYYTNSQSLLRQIYPDWLNNKLLELAVYRDRIAKSRYVQLIGLELGRTSRVTSDQIYDNVKDYFDKRAVIDLEQQTFKSVVGNEPFTEYKVYTTRNGVGALHFDNALNGADINVSALADLDHNSNKVYAGLGIPKQYLGADDTGSALSNGSSLFFLDETYQKRVISYVKRIANGLCECVKNLLIQQEGIEFFYDWDFNVEFKIPESNEDVYRVKNSRLEYVNAILELVDKIEEAKEQGKEYSIKAITDLLQEDIREFIEFDDEDNNIIENNNKESNT